MSESFSADENIHLFNVGVSNKSDTLKFHINVGEDTSSFLRSQKTGLNSDLLVKTVKSEYFPVITLDEFVEEYKIDKIHILKMDIQGSELNALRGAENLLKEKKVDVIYLETYFIQQYVDQPLFYDIADYLNKFGYILQVFYNPIYGRSKLAWCDVVFTLK